MAILEAAREFHVLPEVVENEMTGHWWHLRLCYLEELRRAQA
jgi:hypothetical protein